MSALSHLALCLCYVSVAVTVISLFLPQKRTRKIFSFVIGLFVVCALVASVKSTSADIGEIHVEQQSIPESDENAYYERIKQATADNLVQAADELLQSEGIEAKDIRIRLKISDEGRIYVEDAVIYISESDLLRKQEIERIVYTNLSKESRVYVEKEVESAGSQ